MSIAIRPSAWVASIFLFRNISREKLLSILVEEDFLPALTEFPHS